jgi:peptidyl-prolyl cis-trans isomerase D
MLLAFSERIKGWLGGVIVALIALPFALWGIQSYIGGGEAQIAASIDDREISLQELDRSTSQLRQQLQASGSKLPNDVVLKRRALDQIINSTVLETASYEQGYRVSDGTLAANMQKIFQRDGVFDREYFVAALASQGLTPQSFEQRYRSELRVQQQREAIMNSAIVSDAVVRKIIELEQQQREISWLKLNIDKLATDVSVSEEEVQDYYTTRSSQFLTPQKVSIEYVELDAEVLTDVDIDQAQLQLLYDDYVVSAKQREDRKASHILISAADDKAKAKQKINQIKQKLTDGADFAELAKQNSEDSGSAEQGGDLGWVENGQMVKPFEDALYALKKGGISDVVESEFGYHLIKLEDVRGVEIKSFAEKRDELQDRLKQEAADNRLYELSEIMATTAYENPDSLDPVADALGQPVKSSELFTIASGEGIAQYDAVRKAAFSNIVLNLGENSELIEVAPNHVLILRLKQNIEAAPVPLETVRSTIAESIRITKGQEITSKLATELIEKLQQGAAIDDVLQDGITDEGTQTIDKKSIGEFDRYFVREIMTMPSPADGKSSYRKINLGSGDVAVVILQKVILPEKIDDAVFARTKSQFKRAIAAEDFGAILTAYKNRAAIHINQKIFEQE